MSSTFDCSDLFFPSAVNEKCIWRLSTLPIIRAINFFSSTERINLEVLEQVNPKASAISPEVSRGDSEVYRATFLHSAKDCIAA